MGNIKFVLVCLFLTLVSSSIAAQDVYHNPVDGKDYQGDWKTYQPETPRPQSSKRVKSEGVVLLTSQDEIAASISVQELANYIMTIEAVFDQDVQNHSDNGQVMVQVELNKDDGPDIKMSHNGNVSDDFLQKIYNDLQSVAYPKVTNKNVKFQVMFSIAGA